MTFGALARCLGWRKLIYRCRQLEAEKSIGLSLLLGEMANEKGVKKAQRGVESLIHENLFAKWKGALEKHKQKEKWVSIYFLLQEERASLSSPCSFSLTRFSSLY